MRYFLSFFFLLCIVSGAHAAKLYKWVDAEGNVQFTQTPPPTGVEAESRTLRSTRNTATQQPEEEDDSEEDEDNNDEDGDSTKTPNQLIDKKNKEVDAENCRRARKQIADLSVDVDLMTQDEKDPSKYIKLTKEARKQRIEQAESYAEHYCDKNSDDE